MNIFEDLQLANAIVGDLAAFAAGKPIAATQNVAGKTFSFEVVHLPDGPVAPYQSIGGNILMIFLTVMADAQAISAGAPVSLAIKEGVTWYGVTVALVGAGG